MTSKSLETRERIKQDAEKIKEEKKINRKLFKTMMGLTDKYPNRYSLRRKIKVINQTFFILTPH